MKILKYMTLAITSLLMASCMGDGFDDPNLDVPPYGNNDLDEENVISINELKDRYKTELSTDQRDGVSYAKIEDDIKIKGYVTGNDIGGNIYNQIGLEDDEAGAIIVCISQGGLFGYLPVGTEILISLKDLYVGAYGLQPEIGTPYTNKNGLTYVSRMSRNLWASHFKIIGARPASVVTPWDFDKNRVTDASYLKEHCGKLMKIKNVEFTDADGTMTFAPEEEKDAANCVGRSFKGINASSMVVRTSTYADFASVPLPKGKIDVTGIFTRYGNTWQILLRTLDDIQPSTTNE